MKYILLILLILNITLNAGDEFPHIEPIAVEYGEVEKEVKEIKAPEPEPKKVEVKKTKQVKEPQQDLDSDNDGIVDSKDNYSDTSRLQTPKLKINFAHDSYKIAQEFISELKKFDDFLQDNINYKVIIYGHTDNVGEDDYNLKLSKNRALAVKEALINYGIDEIRLTAIGKSEHEPIMDNDTDSGRYQNRRIEIELLQ